MDINRLRYFCVLSQTGNMRKAAELLGVTPPALSKAIRVLEEEMGFKLTAPSGRGIMITERGLRLSGKASRLIREIEALRDDEVSKGPGPLRIGSFEVFTTYFLGELVKEGFPDRPVSVHELLPGQIESALGERQIDLGVTYLPVPAPDLDFLQVTEVQMGVYGAAALASLPVDRLPFAVPVAPITGTPTKVRGLDGWPDDRVPRFCKYRVTLMESAMELCRRGLAVAYLPSFIVRLHNRNVAKELRLGELPLPKGMKAQRQPVFLVKRKSDLEDDVFKKAAKVLRMAASGA